MRRRRRDVQCDGKVKFLTFTAARQACRRIRDQWSKITPPYRCKFCGKFHVGSSQHDG